MPKKEVSKWLGSRKVCTLASVVASHNWTALSSPLLASSRPSELHATPYAIQLWPRSSLGGALPSLSQMVTSVSEPALATRLPSALQPTSSRSTPYPYITRTHSPPPTSHTPT